MYGQIPHRLPEPPTRGEGEAREAAERASGRGASIDGGDGFDEDGAATSEFRSDFVGPEFERSSGPASPSIGESESLRSEASNDSVTAEEERAGKAAEASAEASEGEGEGGERAATSTAAADLASTSTSSSSSTPPAKPAAAAPPPPPRPSWPPPRRPKKTYSQLQLPSPEQMAQEEAMNNCGVRTVLSGVMGAGLGVVFGIFMGTMDMAGVSFFSLSLSLSLFVSTHEQGETGGRKERNSRFFVFDHFGTHPTLALSFGTPKNVLKKQNTASGRRSPPAPSGSGASSSGSSDRGNDSSSRSRSRSSSVDNSSSSDGNNSRRSGGPASATAAAAAAEAVRPRGPARHGPLDEAALRLLLEGVRGDGGAVRRLRVRDREGEGEARHLQRCLRR